MCDQQFSAVSLLLIAIVLTLVAGGPRKAFFYEFSSYYLQARMPRVDVEPILSWKTVSQYYTLVLKAEGKVIFERKILKLHEKIASSWIFYITKTPLLTILSAPVIYSMILPAVFSGNRFMDLSDSLLSHLRNPKGTTWRSYCL